jgi:Zn-dependent protease
LFGITRDLLFQFLVRALVLFTAMPVHECAHGLVATRLGDETPRLQGRLTLNPLAHLDLTGSILLFLTGFGWAKPVQVDMRNFSSPRRDMALTSLAGPVSNLLMAFVVLVVLKTLPVFIAFEEMSGAVITLFEILSIVISINLSLAVFNLLPVPPLDGSKIFGAILPEKLYWGMLRHQRIISGVMLGLLYFGVLSLPLNIMSEWIFTLLDKLTYPRELIWKS